jgi:hypothetical protein
MRKLFWLPVWVGCIAGCLPGATIQYEVTSLPAPGQFHYTYFISDVTLHDNSSIQDSIDIDFPVGVYGSLSNGAAGPGFTVLLFQPDNPPGVDGDYSAIATVDSPSLSGTFGVDFTYLGTGTPGPQAFSINEFDGSGNFITTVSEGFTTPLVVTAAPEPGTVLLGGIVLAVCSARRLVRRRGGRSIGSK